MRVLVCCFSVSDESVNVSDESVSVSCFCFR